MDSFKSIATHASRITMTQLNILFNFLLVLLLLRAPTAVKRVGNKYYLPHFLNASLPIPPSYVKDAVVIIGAAGFLGYHFTMQLASIADIKPRILAIDNFNVDYSPALKRKRADQLKENFGIIVYEIDVCLMEASPFTADSTFNRVIVLSNPVPHFVGIERGVDVFVSELVDCFAEILQFTHNHSTIVAGRLEGTVSDRLARLIYTYPVVNDTSFNTQQLAYLMKRKLLRYSASIESVGMHLPTLFGTWDHPLSFAFNELSSQLLDGASVDTLLNTVRVNKYMPVGYVVEKLIMIMRSPSLSTAATKLAVAPDVEAEMGKLNHHMNVMIRPRETAASQYEDKRLTDTVERFSEWFIKLHSDIFPCASECSHSIICGASPWDQVISLTSRLTMGCRFIIYTVATGYDVDALHDIDVYQHLKANVARCNIAFVNKNNSMILPLQTKVLPRVYRYGNWTLVQIDDFSNFEDERKPSRVPKLSPGKFFAPSVEYAIYVDSKLQLTKSPLQLVYEQIRPNYGPHAVALMAVRIGTRFNVFFHIDHIMRRTVERPSITFYKDRLIQQGRAYFQYHERYGIIMHNLFDGAYMVHNLKLKSAQQFRCEWFEEYQQWADRDQVAQSFILNKRIFDLYGAAAEGSDVDLLPMAMEAHGRYDQKPVYLKLLPREEYYWDGRNATETIARLNYFTYSRWDDQRFTNETQEEEPQ